MASHAKITISRVDYEYHNMSVASLILGREEGSKHTMGKLGLGPKRPSSLPRALTAQEVPVDYRLWPFWL